jgi:hypothetical protein
MEDKKPPRKKRRALEQTETMQEYNQRLREEGLKLKGSSIAIENVKTDLGYKWCYDEKTRSYIQKIPN